jgi:hypothetical protein
MGSPLIFAPTENDPLLVPDAAPPPLIVSHDIEEVAVQVSVPDPLFVTVTVWLDGLAPPCIAENEIEAGFRAMTGIVGAGVGAGAGAADVVGVSSWVRPGIAVDSVFIPRPLALEFPPLLDEPGAATPAMGEGLDAVEEDELERAPASESDAAGVVEVVDDCAGATALDAVEFNDVASLRGVGALSTTAVDVLRDVDPVCDDVVAFGCTDARGADFLMSLCDLRTGAGSFEVERVFAGAAGVRSGVWAFSCPSAINCSADANGIEESSTVSAMTAASERRCPADSGRDSKCCMNPPRVTSASETGGGNEQVQCRLALGLSTHWKLWIMKGESG